MTDKDVRRLGRRYEGGEAIADLAREVGYTYAGLNMAFKRLGVKMRGRGRPSKRLVTVDDPRVIEAFRLRDEGMGYVRAAEQSGLASITLRRLLVESGRDPQKRWKGEGAPNWNGGRQRNAEGYIRTDAREFTESMGDTRGMALEHRLVMARHLARPLLPEETVHHLNGKRDDNRLENLELWSSRHAKGQRVEDLRQFAKEILDLYPD